MIKTEQTPADVSNQTAREQSVLDVISFIQDQGDEITPEIVARLQDDSSPTS